ncbi:ABC transporter permease [Arcanobacterium haemolyticum]|nr:ABC transporter permease [Arcanobacterium haemolyticum]
MKREFTTVLGAKSTKISTAVIVLLCLIGGFVVGQFVNNDDEGSSPSAPTSPTFALTDGADELASYLETLGATVTEATADPETLIEENPDWIVVSGTADAPELTAKENVNPYVDLVVLAATERLIDQAGALTPELDAQLQVIQQTQVSTISTSALSRNPIGYIAGTVGIMLLMMTSVMGIAMLTQGVVEEKSSRVVEILLATVRPRTLLLGKILGIGSAVITIFAIYLVGIIGGVGLAGYLDEVTTLGKLGMWEFIPMIVVWVVVGYFTGAAIAGGIASTVSRQEDLGSVQSPIIFLQLVPLYTALYLVPALPDATITKVLSYIPFLSPYLMTMRGSLGDVALWEQGIALVISLATIPLLAMLAGKIYERSILHTGERIKLGQVFKKAA